MDLTALIYQQQLAGRCAQVDTDIVAHTKRLLLLFPLSYTNRRELAIISENISWIFLPISPELPVLFWYRLQKYALCASMFYIV
jgi:hypothetical protein